MCRNYEKQVYLFEDNAKYRPN